MIQHQVVEYLLLPDEREPLEKELKRLADQRQVHVIFTTGGTGFSVRDITPGLRSLSVTVWQTALPMQSAIIR